jgi:putative serine protease PepD
MTTITDPPSRPRRLRVAAALGATAIVAGTAGAALHAATDSSPTSAAPAAVAAAPTSVAATSSSQLSVGAIYAAAAKSVVEITTSMTTTSPFGNSGVQQAQGTGFVYDTQGHIVTNQHVIDGANSVTVAFADGSKAKATVVGSDASTDIAVLKVSVAASKLHPLTFADSSNVAVGDGVVAIGDPFGLDNTVTAGIVSAIDREISAPDNSPITGAIQTDAAINHGNSGGPLLDMHGKVIGITSQIESESGGNDGVGFAVPSNTVSSVASQLIANGKAVHARLGVAVQTIPAGVASSLSLPAGVAVTTVSAGSAADNAGLREATGTKSDGGTSYPTGGDVITAVDGKSVASAEQLRGIISGHKPGDKVALSVTRDGATRTVTVTLGSAT